MSDLVQVMQALYRSEINCGLQSFWDAGFEVWIDDDMNGRKALTQFGHDELGSAARWLHERAIELFPGSLYARSHG